MVRTVPSPIGTPFADSPLPQAVAGLDARFKVVNTALTELLGRTEEQLVGCHVDDVASPEDPGSRIGELLQPGGGELLSYERLLVRGDGVTVPVRLVASLIRGRDGAPQGVSAYYIDLSDQRRAEATMRGHDALYRALVEHASELAAVVAPDGSVLYANATVGSFGYRPEDVVGTSGLEFVHPEDKAAVEVALERVQAVPGLAVHRTYRLRHATDGFRHVESWFTNKTQDPDIAGIVVNTRDVTVREEAARALRASEDRYRTIVETAQEGVWVASPTGENLYLNQKMADMLGRTVAEVLTLTATDLLDEEQAAMMTRRLQDRRREGVGEYELEYHHPDGSTRRFLVRSSPLVDGEQDYVGSLAMVCDVTESRRMEEVLRRHALYDDLTRLPNRTLLDDRLGQAADRRVRGSLTSLTVIVIDIDDFARVNLELGHAAGDRVLVELADRLDAERRPGDTLARFLSDEFVVLAEDLSHSEVAEMATHLLAQVARPLHLDDRTLHLTASIGAATSPGCPRDELLRTAHSALEAAKSHEGGAVEIRDVGAGHEAQDQLRLAADLREALAKGELELHYQPIVELSTGRLLGLESLVRWGHAEKGLVPPAVLLAAAERTGLSPALDSWALGAATAALAELRAADHVSDDVYVSVNISARHLTQGDLEGSVVKALTASGLPADRLGLELTETAFLSDSSPASTLLERIAGRGVAIALDGFGTGYSSLARLTKLPVARVKIDRMFVENLPHDVDDLALVASVLELARAVRVDTVAVGVSNGKQAEVMARLECHAAQGSFWIEPVGLSTLVQRLTALQGHAARSGSSKRADEPGPVPTVVRASREHGLHRLLVLHQGGASLRSIAAALNSEGFRTPVGSRWHPTSVASVIADHAYPSLWSRPGD